MIQEITCPDAFVSISNSTVPLRRLFQQHRPQAVIPPVLPDRPGWVGRGTSYRRNENYEAGARLGHTHRKILRRYKKPASDTASSSHTEWARRLPAPGVRWLSTKLPRSPPTNLVASGWKPTMPLMRESAVTLSPIHMKVVAHLFLPQASMT